MKNVAYWSKSYGDEVISGTIVSEGGAMIIKYQNAIR